jgi:hypothetical protein
MLARTLLPQYPTKKKETRKKCTINQNTFSLARKHLIRAPTHSTKMLKNLIPASQHLGIIQIQRICQKTLTPLSRKRAAKPSPTERIKEKQIAFANQHHH